MWLGKRYKNHTKQAIAKRRQHRGFNDLLSYLLMLDESTILHKDGALSRHFSYLAPDIDSSTDEEVAYHVHTWEKSFNFLGNGWMVETNVTSQPFAPSTQCLEFPDRVSALLDDERRLQYQQGWYFKTVYYLSMTWKPEALIASSLRRFAINSNGAIDSTGIEEELAQFNRVIDEFIGYLKRSLIHIAPLKENMLTSFLYQCITGHPHDLVKPYAGAFLDCYLAGEDFMGGFEPSMGKKHIKVLAIDDLPSHSYPCILDTLSCFPLAYRWSSRYICLDPRTAKSYLKRYERNWSSKAIGVLGVLRESLGMPSKLDEDAQQTANELRAAQVENSGGAKRYGFYNSAIVLMHEDKDYIDKMAIAIIAQIQKMDFRVREESVNASEAFLGSIPCHGDYNLRKMMVDSQFVSHVLPASSVFQGLGQAPCRLDGYRNQPPLLLTTTQGNRPFVLNLHIGDVGHSMIIGPTGSGKSTLIAMLMASHRKYPGSRVIVLDKDCSHRLFIKALGGDYIDMAHDTCQLSPLVHVDENHPMSIEKAVRWLSDCCCAQGIALSSSHRRLLQEGVMRLAQEKQAYKNLRHLSLQDTTLREAIDVLNTGSFGHALNGTQLAFSNQEVIGINIDVLVDNCQQHQATSLPVIKAIFHELEYLFVDKRPTLLVLEEAWLYLKHPLFSTQLKEWFKTLRKFNVSVLFISQDLNDIVHSDAHSTLQSACMTRIFLPNQFAMEHHVAEQYRLFGLNDKQIHIIQQAIPKRDYYYQSPLGNRLFRLDLGEIAKTLVCISSGADEQQFLSLYNPDDPAWLLAWLKEKGLSHWCEFVKHNYFDGVQHA